MSSQSIDLFGEPHVYLKTCCGCKVKLPLSEFSISSNAAGAPKKYRRSECKECWRVRGRAWYHKHKGGLSLTRVLKAKYGITADAYYSMLKAQNNACAICKKSGHTQKRLSVDHCHETGKVRGLLCHLCNQAIGQLHHDVDRLKNAIKYLRKHGKSGGKARIRCKDTALTPV